MINEIASGISDDFLYINGDDPAIRLAWNNPSQAFINNYIGNYKVIVIDEAQRIENIGLSAKMIIDTQKDIQLFLSGSSSLEIASKINEPLTGRKWEYRLYPLSWFEIKEHFSFAKTVPRLEDFLVTGMYPEIVINPENAKEILNNLAGSYLYKDVLELAAKPLSAITSIYWKRHLLSSGSLLLPEIYATKLVAPAKSTFMIMASVIRSLTILPPFPDAMISAPCGRTLLSVNEKNNSLIQDFMGILDIEKLHLFTQMLRVNNLFKRAKVTHK